MRHSLRPSPVAAGCFPSPGVFPGACSTERLQARASSLLATECLPAPSLALGWGLSFLAAGRFTTHGVLCPEHCRWHLSTEHRWCQHTWEGSRHQGRREHVPVLWDGAHYTLPSFQISLPLASLRLGVCHQKAGSQSTSSPKYEKRHGHF